ncbi:MAG: penicillin acylase family protein, partial [Candidatus Zixiibacteriota bacterium]
VFNSPAKEFWFDDVRSEPIESRHDISVKAVANAIEIVGNKTWGEFNSLTMRHPMSEIPLLGGLLDLNRGVWPWPGTAGTLNASYVVSRNDSTFETIVGPSWRFVIDFADIDGASFVLPAGNSGNPMSPHFFDFNQMWQKGEYWNVPISYERVKASSVSTLTLKTPAVAEEN